MRITILTIGTQGDVRPFIALGRGLRVAGHNVRIAASTEFQPVTVRQGLAFAPLSADFRALMAQVHDLMDKGTNPVLSARIMRRALTGMAAPWAAEGLAACSDADLIIASGLADLLGASLAEALRKPFALAYLQPILPSRELPPVTLPPRELPGWANLLLHHAARVVQWQVLRPAFNRHVRPGLGLPRYPWHGPRYAVGQAACPVLLGYSRHAVPRPRAWPAHVRVTGYWFLDEEETWSPPRGLVEFLDAGPPPIYIGFGSMPSRDPEAATRLVVGAVRRSGQRAVLATGWNGLREPPQGLGDGIYVIREAPHAWLFRRIALAVHHGGGGTTAAAIRAGIPSVVVPFLADQPFWAWQMARLGVAPPGLNHKTLTPKQLARTIMVAAGAEMRDRAKRLGDHILGEDGIHAAAMVLAEWGLLPGGCYRHPQPGALASMPHESAR